VAGPGLPRGYSYRTRKEKYIQLDSLSVLDRCIGSLVRKWIANSLFPQGKPHVEDFASGCESSEIVVEAVADLFLVAIERAASVGTRANCLF
jgi:hypothetical protein